MFHGQSIDDIVKTTPGLSYDISGEKVTSAEHRRKHDLHLFLSLP